MAYFKWIALEICGSWVRLEKEILQVYTKFCWLFESKTIWSDASNDQCKDFYRVMTRHQLLSEVSVRGQGRGKPKSSTEVDSSIIHND